MELPQLPRWSTEWVYFANWPDLAFAGVGSVLVLLLIVWWRQQTSQWFRVTMITLLGALLLCIASFYLFEVPAYYASCPQGCLGWRGYPRPFATTHFDGSAQIARLDFALNWLMLWLLWLLASVIWRLLGVAFQWQQRSLRTRLLFVLVVAVLPWAFLPHFLDPPQPTTVGEALRLATNARRSAEFTYGITGLWVQRLALEDVQFTPSVSRAEDGVAPTFTGGQVCLRGYTYFYIPWRRYRITLDTNGVTALSLTQLPLSEPCWE
jgi:lysylphosphatidylglycerol synthetase-like protein (DUF2156 family)